MSEDCTTAFAWISSTTSYFGTKAKVHPDSDILKPFSSEDDVVAWLKNVRLVARLQHVDHVASLLPLYLEGDAKSGLISNVICHRCNSKGHIAKSCRKRGTRCFQCGEIGHWARD